MKISPVREERGETVYHAVHKESTLVKLLREFLEAYKARTEAFSKPPIGETSIAQKLDAILDTQTGLVIAVADVPFIKEEVSTMHELTFEIKGKVEELMATQEERLQAILVAVKNVKQMLADLKLSNPAIEDEIAAIEAELAPAETPPEG